MKMPFKIPFKNPLKIPIRMPSEMPIEIEPKMIFRMIVLLIFTISTIYIFFYKTERYESKSVVALKDLSRKQAIDSIGSMFLSGDSSDTQDSRLLELYIKSHEMYAFLEYKFNLSQYYTSKSIDRINRLYKNATFKFMEANKENLLAKYNRDLTIVYDESTGTLSINFASADRNASKVILQTIINRSAEVTNQFEKENAKVALRFIEKQSIKNKAIFIESIKDMLRYQNKHLTIDPNIDVQTQSTIIANLETELMQKEIEYNSKAKFFNENTYEMRLLKDTMRNIEKNIGKVKHRITGKSKQEKELNKNVFDYELIKSDMEFNKEIYRQTLINQEELKVEVNHNAKNLLTITTPTVAESYTYPTKYKDTLTVLLILSFLYGIIMMIITIIKDHQD